jgi:hypothetical protein
MFKRALFGYTGGGPPQAASHRDQSFAAGESAIYHVGTGGGQA